MSALWATGVRFRWSFQLIFPRQETCLIWDGEKLHRTPTTQTYDCLFLAVRHTGPSRGLGDWLSNKMDAATLNAGLVKTLQKCCYVCPVPLSVDSRRLDSLLDCPSHGLSAKSSARALPLKITTVGTVNPSLSLPEGTFRGVAVASARSSATSDGLGSTWQSKAAVVALSQGYAPGQGSCPVLFSVRMKSVGSGDSKRWADSRIASRIYWVQDGAVVNQETLPVPNASAGVAIYVNADDLDTDLSGFRLSEEGGIKDRRRSVLKQVAEFLVPSSFGDLFEIVERNFRKGRRVDLGKAAMVSTLGVLSLPIGFLAMPTLFLAVGGWMFWRTYHSRCHESRLLEELIDVARHRVELAIAQLDGPTP